MIHSKILAAVPRIIDELSSLSDPHYAHYNRDHMIEGGRDVCYRLLCKESLSMMAKELKCSQESVYKAIEKVLTASSDELAEENNA